jgi:import inner membrane translocase subunit TIM21
VGRAAETSFYILFGMASLAALGALTYILAKELLSFGSPQGLYRNAFKYIKRDRECLELFGANMKAHGEESGRGRRRHIANQKFQKDGQERLRVMFHVKVGVDFMAKAALI